MDFNEAKGICRFCLNELTENCEPVEEIIQHTFNFLTLCPNLTISDDPTMCETCAVNLKQCFDFKTKCLSTEDCIASFVDSKDNKVDLQDVYSKVKLDGIIDKLPVDHRVCRFCLELVKDDVSESVKHDADLNSLLQKYFIEMDLKLTDDILACPPCYNSLQFHVSFVNNHLGIEERISEYYKVEGANYKGQVDLRNVATFISKSRLNDGNASDLIIKNDEHENIVDTKIDTEIKFEELADVKQENGGLVNQGIQQTDSNRGVRNRGGCEETTEKYSKIWLMSIDSACKKTYGFHQHSSPSQSHREQQLIGAKPAQYSCDICAFRNDSRGRLQEHILAHIGKALVPIYNCEICSFKTNFEDSLKEHMLRCWHGTLYICDVCNYETKRESELQGHVLTHKAPSENVMYICESCPYETSGRDSLRLHRLIHVDMTEIEMYKCKVCSFESKWEKQLRKHLLSHRMTPGEVERSVVCICALCGYEAKWRYHLQKHVMAHHAQYPSAIAIYKCVLCDFETKYKSFLKTHIKTHMVTHMRISMYECDVCEYATRYKGNLKKHILIHKTPS